MEPFAAALSVLLVEIVPTVSPELLAVTAKEPAELPVIVPLRLFWLTLTLPFVDVNCSPVLDDRLPVPATVRFALPVVFKFCAPSRPVAEIVALLVIGPEPAERNAPAELLTVAVPVSVNPLGDPEATALAMFIEPFVVVMVPKARVLPSATVKLKKPLLVPFAPLAVPLIVPAIEP